MTGIQQNGKDQEAGIEMAVSSTAGAAHRSSYRSYRIGRVTTLRVIFIGICEARCVSAAEKYGISCCADKEDQTAVTSRGARTERFSAQMGQLH